MMRETFSLCPECRKRIPATYVEQGGCVHMQKECPEHGAFKPLIARHGRHFWDLMGLYDRLHASFPYPPDAFESCAFTTTLRCNLQCPICFAGDHARIMPLEQSLDQVAKGLEVIRGRGMMFKIHGGEPTLREDLADIIRMVRESGNYPVLVTNAIKLDDFEYFKALKDSGLYAIGPSFDTLTDDRIYEGMRGRPLVEQRKKVLENVRRLGLKLLVFFVAVKGFNEDQFPAILEMTREYPEMYKVIFLGYMHRGHRGFSEANEYTADETWEAVVRHTDVFDSLDEFDDTVPTADAAAGGFFGTFGPVFERNSRWSERGEM